MMWLISMAWKNIWRNRNRTFITIASIFFAAILSILTTSLQEGTFDNLVKNVVSFYSGYIQVHQRGYWDEQTLDNSFEQSSEAEKKISGENNVHAVTPRLESFVLASSEDITKGCIAVGIDPERENLITSLEGKLSDGHYLHADDQKVLLAQGLSERLKLKVQDTVILIGQGYHGAMAAGKYVVKGILKFGSPELNEKALFIPLPAAQEFYSAQGRITSYILSLKDTKELGSTASFVSNSLGPAYEVMTWEEIMPDIKQHIRTDTNNMKYITGVLYMLISFGIFGTLLMIMVEREFELGMLVAIGMKKGLLIMLLLLESLFTTIMGCVLGITASIPVVYYLHLNPIRFGGETAQAFKRFGFEAVFPTTLNPVVFINQGLIVLLIGLCLSMYPIYKVVRLNPVEALKHS